LPDETYNKVKHGVATESATTLPVYKYDTARIIYHILSLILYTHTTPHTHTNTQIKQSNTSPSPVPSRMDYSHLFNDMDIDMDDMEILEAAISCSPPETINREQPAEASESCPLKDLIKLEKPIRFEAANPPHNTNDPNLHDP